MSGSPECMPFTLSNYAVLPLHMEALHKLIYFFDFPNFPLSHRKVLFFNILSESLSTPSCLGCLTFISFNITSHCLYFLKLRLSPKSPLIVSNSDSIMSLPTALILAVTTGI